MDYGHYGTVEDCDFSAAILDACRFINVDIARVRLPTQPHVLVPEPHRVARILDSSDWPSGTRVWASTLAEELPSVNATVDHMAMSAKRYKVADDVLGEAVRLVGGVFL
jgi:hypothetical protein